MPEYGSIDCLNVAIFSILPLIRILSFSFRTSLMYSLVSFELKEHYLLVIGNGSRDNLASMVEASNMIYEKVQQTQVQHLLVDYRKLQINVQMNEAFNIVKRYEVAQPELKELTIAAVFEAGGIEFGKYWQKIGQQRGFFIEIFEDIEVAEKWLLAQLKKEI
jgi:hypothetical protein